MSTEKTYSVLIHKKSDKYLKKLPVKIQKSFNNWKEELKKAPYNANNGQLVNRKLNDLPIYKKRLGDYRVLYTIVENEILVLITNIEHKKITSEQRTNYPKF